MNAAAVADRIDTPPPAGALLVGCVVAAAFVPALEHIVDALRDHSPNATDAQLLDMILLRGIVAYTDELNLPRIGSNPDQDA